MYLPWQERAFEHVSSNKGEQLFMAATTLVIRLCACVRYWPGSGFHRRKMSAHALLKMTRDRFRVMSLAPRRKCPRNVVEMKVAMAAFFGSDSVANFLPL